MKKKKTRRDRLTTCSGISTSQRRHILDILHPKDLGSPLIEWETNCCSCWGNVFEGGCCWEI
jgi:hypothetical protein